MITILVGERGGSLMGEVIRIEQVTWRKAEKEILRNINWHVKEGEHWGILGLNGSGKTSLLNIVTGYQFPTSGKVVVLENEYGKTNIPELRKKIGYVSSKLDDFNHHLLREKVEAIVVSGKFASFGLYEEVYQEDWEKAAELLASLRLKSLSGKYYRDLSQGEQRKTLIARALMADPEILILDEPCSGLDILSREEVLELLAVMDKRNCHILYVTHHTEEIVDTITHVLLIRDGEIVATGPKQEVLTDELLSDVYKIPVNVRWENARPWLTVQK